MELLFKQRIKELRVERNLTQGELASELGVLERTVSHWETGKRECDFFTLLKISKFFDVSIDYILGKKNF